MGRKKKVEQVNYDIVDGNQFITDGEYPMASSLGQIEHQTVATSEGRIIDHDERFYDIVDENGLAVIPEDEVQIKGFIKDAISVDKLVETFNENSHETLLKLLALQDNKHPLKKGGVSIAYRTDALIMHCKMEFSAAENIVFDAILGVMSSFPENETYRIEPSSFLKYQKYDSSNSLYQTFRSGASKLKKRLLTFDELGEDGDDEIVVPWFDILRYHGKKKGEGAFIEFRPTAFFKDLALCSQIVHGAYGSLEVTTQLRGKYTIALYWFLENKKRYREYPKATPGVFDMSIEEIKHQFSLSEKYQSNDIDRRVLKPARESINNIDECDFTFDYESQKVSNKIVGYRFSIKEKNYVDAKESAPALTEDALYTQVSSVLGMTGIAFTNDEILRIYGCAKKNNKSAMDLMAVALSFTSRFNDKSLDPIEDKVKYFCRMIEQGAFTDKVEKKPRNKKNNSFENFEQREYSEDEWKKLENALRKN